MKGETGEEHAATGRMKEEPQNNQIQGTPQPYLPAAVTVRWVASTGARRSLDGRP